MTKEPLPATKANAPIDFEVYEGESSRTIPAATLERRDALLPCSRVSSMPRFYFDIHQGENLQKDEEGVELAGFNEARREAQRILPAIAYDENGDHRTYIVLVTDEDQRPVYSATLAYAGAWLLR